MSKVKLYRVCATQPIYTQAYIKATSKKEAIRLAKASELDCGTEIDWKDFDIGNWYGYEAEVEDE
jgi:hypothetical protein